MKSLNITILVTLLFFFSAISAQEIRFDQLQKLEDEELLSLFNEVGQDSTKQEKIARVYLKRAQRENDTIKMARGYDRLARIFHPEKNIQFADSVIALTKDIDNITYPALGYMLKGYEYDKIKNLKLSTENYITAFSIAKKRNNVNQQGYISNMLIYSKAIWGNKNDALNLQKDRHRLISSRTYIESLKESTRKGAFIDIQDLYLKEEIVSVQNFIFCYLNLKKLDSAEFYFKKGIEKKKKFNLPEREYFDGWFLETSVEINYYKKEYSKSLEIIDEIFLKHHNYIEDDNLMNLFYFKGFSLLGLNRYNEGIKYLELSDSIYDIGNVRLQPYDRHLFEKLEEHYKLKNNNIKQLYYLNKLIYLDSIFKENYSYFEPSLIKNYETPLLLGEKEKLITNLELQHKETKKLTWIFLLLFGISVGGLLYYFKRQLIFKKRFEQIMASKGDIALKKNTCEQSKKNEISSELIKNILNQLDEFENKDGFLSTEVSLNELSKSFGTNARYLSKIINLEKEKNFSQYINDLRVEYAFSKLENNRLFRKYTIKAVANECGFNRAESFSKAFYKKFKIYPSFYLKTLEKEESKKLVR